MNKVRKITPLVLLLALWMGCATHPSISPEITPVDEINWGYTFSVENTIPMIGFVEVYQKRVIWVLESDFLFMAQEWIIPRL